MKTLLACFVVLLISAFAPLGQTWASEIKMNIPPGDYAHHLGNKAIADPSGTTHTRQEIAGKVVVAIFSVPSMSQGDSQQRWADLLATNPKTKLPESIALILIEDISQAGMFKNAALKDMKKEFTPDSRPFLVLDQDGSVTKRFGVHRDRTEILIYDKHGTLRDVETNLDNQKLTLERIHAISHRLQEE